MYPSASSLIPHNGSHSHTILRQWAFDNAMSAQANIFWKHYYNLPTLVG